ncbi:alanine racemase [Helicobacter marmotae]|uniref:Alanine racemase n=1 Tax=Helicobacter marmotae TaxID=152490 RepID=A0A3D8I565_9HELI|nr:alanine racemase [Helicobacter marmotae]RDU60279.1 alanine racemase [Helicobacter marmotae]
MMKQYIIATYFVFSFLSVGFASPILHKNTTITRENANAFMEVDLNAFEKNLQVAKDIAGNAKVCAVLKADAYGAGIANVLPSVIKAKIPCVAITSNEEARVVRELGYEGQVLRIRMATPGELKDGLAYHITETIGNLEQAKYFDTLAKGKKLPIHINLNSGGMDRNGIDLSTSRGKTDVVSIATLPHLKVEGLMTHFPYEDVKKIKEGLKRFQADSAFVIENAHLNPKSLTLHAAASWAAVHVRESRLDMIRPGKLIYGYGGDEKALGIEQVMSLKSQVAGVNAYPKGSKVSYDGTYTLKRDSLLANIPMGYYDGYAKSFSNKGHVLIRGHKLPIVGRVTKNTFMVDVSDYPQISSGDEVVLFGKQCTQAITQSEIEKHTGTILSESLGIWGSSNPIFIKDSTLKDKCD